MVALPRVTRPDPASLSGRVRVVAAVAVRWAMKAAALGSVLGSESCMRLMTTRRNLSLLVALLFFLT